MINNNCKKKVSSCVNNEQTYRNIVENSNEAIIVIQDEHFKFFNRKALDLTRYSKEEFSNLILSQMIHPEDRQSVLDSYQELLKGKIITGSYECRILTRFRNSIWVQMNAVQILWDEYPAILVFFTEITERKNAEKALQESEEKYRTFIENIPIGVYRNTPGAKGKFLMTNPAFRKIFGYDSEEEMKKINVSDLYVNPLERKTFSDNLMTRGSIGGEEILLKKKDGTPIWCSITARVAYKHGTKEVAYFDGTIEDITKRKQAEENVLQLYEELEMRVIERTEELQTTNQKLQETLEKLQKDEEAGKAIQFQLLPEEKKSFGEFEFSRYLLPSMYLSGDFVDYFKINENHLGFYMADVSGHGISSAFVTVFLKSFINNYLEKYKNENDTTILHTSSLLESLNKEVYKNKFGKYLTIFYAVIDINNNKLMYSNAAQFPYPIIFDTEQVYFLPESDCPVGIYETFRFTLTEFILPEKFIVFLASDGILRTFSQENFQEQLNRLLSSIKGMNTSIKNLLEEFELNKQTDFPDDITFLMLKRAS